MLKERQKVYCDVLILGAGPAGLSAAIYAARAKLFTVLIDEGLPGGQVSTTYHVANYPGTNGVIRGLDLVENMKKQALDFGAQIDDLKEITAVNLAGEEKFVQTEDADYYAKSVIIATGAEPRKLPAEGEREFRGRGIHYCATCDGALYQDANVLVVGGGNSAVEEAVFLTRYAKQVTIVHQFDHFQASKAAQDEALKNPNINVIWNSEVRKVYGESFVKGVTVENIKTKETSEIETEGLFVYIGMQPKTDLFKNQIRLNEYGYIPTDEDMRTNIPGVFAAGDVRDKKIRQISTASGDGTIAGIMVERFINGK
ncbi:MAG: thioredoxin-disulfide reductase [Clostridia bacterium]|nr:thioredoxin-disulfide reductase [Clostridia bacterium]